MIELNFLVFFHLIFSSHKFCCLCNRHLDQPLVLPIFIQIFMTPHNIVPIKEHGPHTHSKGTQQKSSIYGSESPPNFPSPYSTPRRTPSLTLPAPIIDHYHSGLSTGFLGFGINTLRFAVKFYMQK